MNFIFVYVEFSISQFGIRWFDYTLHKLRVYFLIVKDFLIIGDYVNKKLLLLTPGRFVIIERCHLIKLSKQVGVNVKNKVPAKQSTQKTIQRMFNSTCLLQLLFRRIKPSLDLMNKQQSFRRYFLQIILNYDTKPEQSARLLFITP